MRGHFDGDGSVYSYFDPRWKNSFMFYVNFVSASKKHIIWLQKRIQKLLGIKGVINKSKSNSVIQLRFAKKEGERILKNMYQNKTSIFLKRKFIKVEKILKINAEVLEQVDRLA